MKGDPNTCDTDLIELCAGFALNAYYKTVDGIFIEDLDIKN